MVRIAELVTCAFSSASRRHWSSESRCTMTQPDSSANEIGKHDTGHERNVIFQNNADTRQFWPAVLALLPQNDPHFPCSRASGSHFGLL